MFDALHNLSLATLRSLAASLRNGPLAVGLSRHALAQVVGPPVAAIHEHLEELKKQGMAPAQIALVLEAIAETRARAADPQLLFELVLSGPEVPGVPTADTAATLQTLIQNAHTEMLLVGYTVHNGKKLFKRLAERMESVPALRVEFCLDIARKPADTSLASETVRRFVHEFVTKHWPGTRLPEVCYDPRALAETWEERASLHAKCVIVGRRVAFVTSANFTEAALKKNIEAGVVPANGVHKRRQIGASEGFILLSVLQPARQDFVSVEVNEVTEGMGFAKLPRQQFGIGAAHLERHQRAHVPEDIVHAARRLLPAACVGRHPAVASGTGQGGPARPSATSPSDDWIGFPLITATSVR